MKEILNIFLELSVFYQIIICAIIFLVLFKFFKESIKFLTSVAVLLILILVILNLYKF